MPSLWEDDTDDSAYYFDWDAHNAAKPPKFWTDARIAKLTHLWNQRWFTKDIATALETTKGAVVGKANRLGLPPRDHSEFRLLAGKSRTRRGVLPKKMIAGKSK